MDEFIKDRDEAVASGDIEKVRAYCKKYDIEIPEDENIFKASMHKAICNMYLMPDSKISLEQYNRSYEWLIANGYTPSIVGGEE
jgi:hypothetical protein